MKNAPKPAKISRISDLKDILAQAKSVAIIDYTHLNVGQATVLRKSVREAGGEIKIEKNTLFKLASGHKDLELKGLSAFVFAKTDEIAPLKVIVDFIKKNSLLSFKAGLYQDKVLSASEIEALAKTPNREISAAKILYLLNYNTSKLVRTLDALARKEVTN